MQSLSSDLTPSEQPPMTGEDPESSANLQSPSVRTELTTTFRRLKASFGRETGSQVSQQETLRETTGTTDIDHRGMDNNDSIAGLNFQIASGFTDNAVLGGPVVDREINKTRGALTKQYGLYFQDIHPTKTKAQDSIQDFFTAYNKWVPEMANMDERGLVGAQLSEWGKFCVAAQKAAKAVKSSSELSVELQFLQRADKRAVAAGLWPWQR